MSGGADRVISMIQLVSQVCSWSTEKACSQWAESAVISDQMKRARMSLPL